MSFAVPEIRTLTDKEIADAMKMIPEDFEHEAEESDSECFGSNWSDLSFGSADAPTQARPKGFEKTSDDFWAELEQGLER